VAVCLPTGSILGLNVKAVLFVVSAASFLAFICSDIREWPTLSEQTFLAAFTACLCFWTILGLLTGESEIMEVFVQLKDVASTVLIAWFCFFFIRRGLLQPESIVKSVVYATVVVGLLKIGLIVSSIFLHADPVQTIESVFGEASLVSGDIGLGLTRLEFSSDIVGAFSLFAILCPSVSGVRARRHIVAAMVLLLVISGLISYSRYIWFVDLFAVVAALLIERRFKLLLLSTLAVAALAGVFYEEVGPLFTARFSSTQVTDSDLTRVEQSKSLLQEIEGHPLLGKGMGQHAQVIRSEQNRYSYELQWMSLLMQTGILGVAVILCLIFATARDLIAVRGPVQLWLAALYLLWLLGSWTNPYLTSSFAGATFGMFIALFYRVRVTARP
jgi:hypothetical protein